ncbi:MAG TPA: hypothetical protein VJQ25_05895 [Nitrospira sp.]|nr:hypothetical protein [Nitrospira sp.]
MKSKIAIAGLIFLASTSLAGSAGKKVSPIAVGDCSGGNFVKGITSNGGLNCVTPSGGGDVSGPGSAADNNVVLFDGSSGTVIKDSGVDISSVLIAGGALGTPSSGNLVNTTGYLVSNLGGLGTNVATFLATPSSNNLLNALTTKTGTGLAVFGTSPSISNLTLSNLSGGGAQCLHVNNSGVVSGTGSDCGSGGGGTSPGGTNGAIQYNSSGVFAGAVISGLVKGNGTGAPTAAISGTDYLGPTSGSAIQKANGSGGLTAAIASTDYIGPTSGTAVQKANGTGGLAPAVSGTDILIPGGALGTPSSGNLVNTTGYLVGNIAGMGTGVSTFLVTPSSANLLSMLTTKTGTGLVVFGTSPTIASPTITSPSISTASISGLTISNITGSTQCLHVNTTGFVSGTGSDCGAGGASLTVTDGTHTVSSTTTMTFNPVGFVIGGSAGSATVAPIVTFNTQTGASYSLQASDGGKSIIMSNASPTTISVLLAATAGVGYSTLVECDAGCVLNRSGSDTIDGLTTVTLAAKQKIYLESNGSTWRGGVLGAPQP